MVTSPMSWSMVLRRRCCIKNCNHCNRGSAEICWLKVELTVVLQSSWSITNPQKRFDLQNLWWWIVVHLGVHNYLADLDNRDNFMLCVGCKWQLFFSFLFNHFSVLEQMLPSYNFQAVNLTSYSTFYQKEIVHTVTHLTSQMSCIVLIWGWYQVKWSHCLFLSLC